jgi:hypothetical protein
MSFSVEIQIVHRYGLECYRAEVGLIYLGGGYPTKFAPFLFDTGAEVTMVSDDVGRALHLAPGGRPVSVTGSVGGGTGRLVEVEFRFADEPGLVIPSRWVVLPSDRKIAILGLRDVLPHFEARTIDFDLFFIRKPRA